MCININSDEFKTLAEKSGIHPILLNTKVNQFQNENGTEDLPTLEELDLIVTTEEKPSFSIENMASNLEDSISRSNKIKEDAAMLRQRQSGEETSASASKTIASAMEYAMKRDNHQLEIDFDAFQLLRYSPDNTNLANTGHKTFTPESRSFLRSLFNKLAGMKNKDKSNMSDESKVALFNIAKILENRFGIEIIVVSKDEASIILNSEELVRGFYNPDTKKSYLVDGVFDEATMVHETFTHPFLNLIRNDVEYKELYANLLKEANATPGLKRFIASQYGKLNENALNDEMIAALIDQVILGQIKEVNSTNVIKKFIKLIHDFIINLLGGKDKHIHELRLDSTLKDIAMFALYGKDKINLLANEIQIEKVNQAADLIVSKSSQFDRVGLTTSIDQFISDLKVSEDVSQALRDYYNDNLPVTSEEFSNGLKTAVNSDKIVRSESKSVAEYAFQKAKRLDVDEVIIANAKRVHEDIIDGLKARLASLELSKASEKEKLKVAKLIEDLRRKDEASAMMDFVDFANEEIFHLDNEIARLSEDTYELRDLDNLKDQSLNHRKGELPKLEEINSLNHDLLGLLNNLSSAISQLKNNRGNIFDSKFKGDQAANDAFQIKLNKLKAKLALTDENYLILAKNSYAFTIGHFGRKWGSSTIETFLDNVEELTVDTGRFLGLYLGTFDNSDVETIRILDKIIRSAKARVQLKIGETNYGKDLAKLTSSLSKVGESVNFSNFLEETKDGKRTGYLLSKLKRGEALSDWSDFMEGLRAKYNLENTSDTPIDYADAIAFEEEKENYRIERQERIFKKEYYELRRNMSLDARNAIDTANQNINDLKAEGVGRDGQYRVSSLSEVTKAKLLRARIEKSNLTNILDEQGNKKTDFEISIAKEITAFNESIKGRISYRVNSAAFDEAKAEAKASLSAKDYTKWINENTRTVIKPEFYETIKVAEKVEQDPAWQALYDEKQAILKRYKHPETGEYIVDWMETDMIGRMSVKAKLDQIESILSSLKKVKNSKSNFATYAEMTPTSYYYKARDLAIDQTKSPIEAVSARGNAWLMNNHTQTPYGEQPNSYWMKIIPKDDKFIEYGVPNSNWSELDESSELVNLNYNLAESKYGMQPSKAYYDNTEAYNKFMKDENNKNMHEKLLEIMKDANSHYSYIKNPDPYRLPQIEGGYINSIKRAGNGERFRTFLNKTFFVDDTDLKYSGTINAKYRTDKSRMQQVPTEHRRMLDNTNAISTNLPYTYMKYLESAINFEEMNKILPIVDTAKEGIKRSTAVKKKLSFSANNPLGIAIKEEVVKAGETKANEKMDSIINRNVYGETSDVLRFKIFDTGKEIDLGRIVKVLGTTAIVAKNLVFNAFSMIGNIFSAQSSLISEATSGLDINKQDGLDASREVSFQLIPILLSATGTRRSNSKIINAMRHFDILGSEVESANEVAGNPFLEAVIGHTAFGGYEAGDFIVKSQMLLGMLKGVRLNPDDNKFYSRSEYVTKFFPGKWDDGMTMFNSFKTDLWDAHEMVDGKFGIMDKYKDAFSEDDLVEFMLRARKKSFSLDGALGAAQKSIIYQNALSASMMVHKGWIVTGLQDKFSSKKFNYIEGRETEGTIISAMKSFSKNAAYPNIFARMFMSKLAVELNNTEDDSYIHQRYAIRKTNSDIRNLLIVTTTAAILSAIIQNMKFEGDDPDKIYYLEYLYTGLLRGAGELASLYWPMDILPMVKEPFTAGSIVDDEEAFANDMAKGELGRVVQKGPYKGYDRWQRHVMKQIPGVKGYMETMAHPDLKAKQKWLIGQNILFKPINYMIGAPAVKRKRKEEYKKLHPNVRIIGE